MASDEEDWSERRQVTALFYDIIDSTGWLQRLDPEEFAAAQHQVHEVAVATIERHGGFVEQVIGDGGYAFFGYPAAFEEAAPAAVRAALELVAQVDLLFQPVKRPPLRIRIGIATGLAILFYYKPERDLHRVRIVGLQSALAARLQAEAEPGGIRVAKTTYGLAQHAIEFEPAGVYRLKGFEQPQQLWRPVRAKPAHDRFSTLRRGDVPLIARAAELAKLQHGWRAACRGQGQAIALVGEPGIGKSRLATELRAEVSRDGGTTCILQCEPRGKVYPLQPLLTALQSRLGQPIKGQGRLDQVEARLKAELATAHWHAIERLMFLFREQNDQCLSRLEPEIPTGDEHRDSFIAAAVEILHAWSHQKPQYLLLEDFHWADSFTQAFVYRLAESIRDQRILLVITSRQNAGFDEVGLGLEGLVELGRLEPTDVRPLVVALWGTEPPAGLAQFIECKSDGVPLFIEQVTLLIKEQLGQGPSGKPEWEQLAKVGRISTIQDFIAARLAALGNGRRIAQIASLLGREFSFPDLQRVVQSELPKAALDHGLDALLRARLIAPADPHGRLLVFRHGLMHEAAYDSLPKTERVRLHGRILDLSLEGWLDLSDEAKSWHAAVAGRMKEAATYAIRAAEDRSARFALHEAYDLITQAEGYLTQVDLGPDEELFLRLLRAKGGIAVARLGAGSAEAHAVYDAAMNRLAVHKEDQVEAWFPLYWGWWFTSRDFKEQRARAKAIIGAVGSARDPEVRLQACHCAWATAFDAGQHQDCLRLIAEGLALYEPERARLSRASFAGHDAKVCGLGERAQALWLIGDAEQAVASMRAAWVHARRIEHLGSLAHVLDNALLLACYRRRYPAVKVLTRRMAKLGHVHGIPGAVAKAQIFTGWVTALATSPQAGWHELEQGLRQHHQTGTEEDAPVYADLRAEVLARCGRVADGIKILDSAIDRAEAMEHRFWLPELYRRRAALVRQQGGDRGLRLSDLRRAKALASHQGALALLRRAEADLADEDW